MEVPLEKARLIEDELLCGPDWDVAAAAKAFPPAEGNHYKWCTGNQFESALCQCVTATCRYHVKVDAMKPMLDEINDLEGKFSDQSNRVAAARSALLGTEGEARAASEAERNLLGQLAAMRETDENVRQRMERGRDIASVMDPESHARSCNTT